MRADTLDVPIRVRHEEARVAGMGGRMSTVIKAKINKLLDRAEDPSETLEYSYQK